jgi:hypothetical protein
VAVLYGLHNIFLQADYVTTVLIYEWGGGYEKLVVQLLQTVGNWSDFLANRAFLGNIGRYYLSGKLLSRMSTQ